MTAILQDGHEQINLTLTEHNWPQDFICVCVFLCVRSLFGVTSSNVELRNYVISRQIVIERRVT